MSENKPDLMAELAEVRSIVAALNQPVSKEELKRAWNMIGQQHPCQEWVSRALIDFVERRLVSIYGVDDHDH